MFTWSDKFESPSPTGCHKVLQLALCEVLSSPKVQNCVKMIILLLENILNDIAFLGNYWILYWVLYLAVLLLYFSYIVYYIVPKLFSFGHL